MWGRAGQTLNELYVVRPGELITDLSIPLDFYLLGRFWRAELGLRTTRHGNGAEAEATTIYPPAGFVIRISIYLSPGWLAGWFSFRNHAT